MKTAPCVPWLVLIASVALGGTSLRADSPWSLSKLWPLDRQRTTKKETSPFRTTSLPKANSNSTQRSARSKEQGGWWPSFSSLASAPKRFWTRTKKLLAPADSRNTAASRTSRVSRRHRSWTRPLGSKQGSDTKTLQDFLKQERPAF